MGMDPATSPVVPVIRIHPTRGMASLRLKDLWDYRELIYFLVWRDIKIRYKQTVVGAVWVLLQPLMTIAIFTVIFGIFAGIPSEGVPYTVYTFAGLLPFTYFAESINRGGASLVGSANLISKVYFPRLIIPLSAVITPIMDFIITFALLIGLITWFGIKPTSAMLALPLLLFFTIIWALAASLWFSALNVRYRDVVYTLPFITQVTMFASPVIYPASIIPGRWRLLYAINPLAGLIDAFRWALLGRPFPNLWLLAISFFTLAVVLVGGVFYFKRMERTFADII
jgi:lipopolysaccharide transport system permease protein